MKNSINLVIRRDEVEEKAASRYRSLRILSVTLLSVIASISVLLFILIATSPLHHLQQQEQDALTALSVYHPKMAKIAIANDRLSALTSILHTRGSLEKQLTWIQQQLPPNVSLESYSVSGTAIDIVVTSNEADALQKLSDTLANLGDTKQGIVSANMTSLTYDTGLGVYSLSLSIKTL